MSNQQKNNILQNAIDSISLGVEDFNIANHDNRRILSSVRNVFAGILLLFKYKLVLLSPSNSEEVFIKKKVIANPQDDGSIVWIGSGSGTINVQEIKERFKWFGIHVDWHCLDNINEYRNNIEHYYDIDNRPLDTLKSAISQAFTLINFFIREHLEENPDDLFANEIWQQMISINDVYQQEKELCLNEIKKLIYINDEIMDMFENYECHDCGYLLLSVSKQAKHAEDAAFFCKACGVNLTYSEVVIASLDKKYSRNDHKYYRDGGECPIASCPECRKRGFIMNEGICFICGGEAETICCRCGNNINNEEMECSPLCGYCFYVVNKED